MAHLGGHSECTAFLQQSFLSIGWSADTNSSTRAHPPTSDEVLAALEEKVALATAPAQVAGGGSALQAELARMGDEARRQADAHAALAAEARAAETAAAVLAREVAVQEAEAAEAALAAEARLRAAEAAAEEAARLRKEVEEQQRQRA